MNKTSEINSIISCIVDDIGVVMLEFECAAKAYALPRRLAISKMINLSCYYLAALERSKSNNNIEYN